MKGADASDAIERELGSIPALSTGLLSASQGSYTTAQLLLDITQGARVSDSTYSSRVPFLRVLDSSPRAGTVESRDLAARLGTRRSTRRADDEPQAGAQVDPWAVVLKRAKDAPQLLEPGLLAAQVSGGGAYLPAAGVESVDGVLAANRKGRIAAVSLAPASPLLGIRQLGARHRLVVADLPAGKPGYADLRALAAQRPAGELLVVLQRVHDEPNNSTLGQAGHELLWVAFAGLGRGRHTLTSQTTNERGLIASMDIGPTILAHLGLAIPPDMRGKPVRLDGSFDEAALRDFKARLEVLGSRRLPAATWLVAACLLLLAMTLLPVGVGERRVRRAWAMRTGALAILWAPVAVLLPALIEPGATVEFVVIVAACFALAIVTDRLSPWPRAPLVPAVVALLVLSVDALAGTQLLVRSLLGPDPVLGARFYGIGNELKSGLAVMVFAGVAAALYPAERGRRAASVMACAGIVLAIVEGSARIGAGVGGVILVSAGTAVASVLLLGGALTRRRLLVVMLAPVVGLAVLAAIDLTTAHGSGHFTGSVLDARSPGDIRDIIVRRYRAAYDELKNHLMPFATALALLASVLALRHRDRICAPVDSDPAWLAALGGGLTAGVIGALSEDSGPVLLVVAVFALGCVLSYLWGKPLPAEAPRQRSRDTHRATQSRARRRSAAPSG